MPKRASKSNATNLIQLGERLKVNIAKFRNDVYFHFRIKGKDDKLSLNKSEMKLLLSDEIKHKIVRMAKWVALEPEKKKAKSSTAWDSSGEEDEDEAEEEAEGGFYF